MQVIQIIFLGVLYQGCQGMLGGFDIPMKRVAFFVQVLKDGEVVCGGSILSARVVLTAGTCVKKEEEVKTEEDKKITNGTSEEGQKTNNETNEEEQNENNETRRQGQKTNNGTIGASEGGKNGTFAVIAGSEKRGKGDQTQVEIVIVHPQYAKKSDCIQNNLAILILAKRLRFSLKVQPVKLPYNASVALKAGTKTLLLGYGVNTNSSNSSQSAHVQANYLTILSDMDCYNVVGECEKKNAPTQFCVGNMTTDKPNTVCDADAGSPLVHFDRLYGLAGSNDDCSRNGSVAVYVNLMWFNSWIRKTAKKAVGAIF